MALARGAAVRLAHRLRPRGGRDAEGVEVVLERRRGASSRRFAAEPERKKRKLINNRIILVKYSVIR